MLAYKYFVEQKENRFIKSAFGKYINPVILKKLMANPSRLRLGGDRKEITILFSDIRSFTTLSEELSPAEIIKFTNAYLEVMTEVILKYNGTIDKYIGDAIMAFWNAPLDDPNQEANAVTAGLEMQQKLKEFNLARPKRLRIKIGIGINGYGLLEISDKAF
jgi:adenylate cyclase